MVQNGKRRNNVVLEELNETDVTRKKSERVIKKAKHQRNEQKTSSGIFNVGHDDEPDDHSDSNTMQENTVENNVNCVNEGKRRHNGGVYHDDDVPYAKELIALQTKYQALREVLINYSRKYFSYIVVCSFVKRRLSACFVMQKR